MLARLGDFLMAAWLAACAAAIFLAGRWLVFLALELWRREWWIGGMVAMGLAFLTVVLGLRVAVPVIQLLRGTTTPRLARRDFRDSVANFLFFLRSGGMWKDY